MTQPSAWSCSLPLLRAAHLGAFPFTNLLQLVRAGDPAERVVLQFGKAEQDAFILDFNPMGGWGLFCGGLASCAAQTVVALQLGLLRLLWLCSLRRSVCRFSRRGTADGWRCPPLGCSVTLCPAAARMHFPPVPPHLVPTPDPTRRLLRPAPPGSPAAVLTASQAFGIVLSTFDSKLFL